MEMSELSDSNLRAAVLQVVDVRKAYGQRVVLGGVFFSVKAGERVALMGPSGSGKTTLLNCLGGVDRPDSGRIVLRDRSLQELTRDQLAEVRRTQVGTIFQFFHLLPTLTAFENIELPLQLLGVPSDERRQRVNELVEKVGITSRKDALPGQLSGGEMQRVAIARALIHHPKLILADEPTGNLDSSNGHGILGLIRKLSDELGVAVVLVTHSTEAAAICHRTLHMRDGLLVGSEAARV